MLFTDGQTCAPCRTAKTNLMRLSASLRGLPVGLGVVDCERPKNVHYCRTAHRLPERPFGPEFHGWPRGVKPSRGQALFSGSQIEAHRALELIDRGLRLALADTKEASAEVALGGAGVGFEADATDEERSKPADEAGFGGGGGGFRWDGPPQPNAKPIPWQGFDRQGHAQARLR